jgi:hypothetical protein
MNVEELISNDLALYEDGPTISDLHDQAALWFVGDLLDHYLEALADGITREQYRTAEKKCDEQIHRCSLRNTARSAVGEPPIMTRNEASAQPYQASAARAIIVDDRDYADERYGWPGQPLDPVAHTIHLQLLKQASAAQRQHELQQALAAYNTNCGACAAITYGSRPLCVDCQTVHNHAQVLQLTQQTVNGNRTRLEAVTTYIKEQS